MHVLKCKVLKQTNSHDISIPTYVIILNIHEQYIPLKQSTGTQIMKTEPHEILPMKNTPSGDDVIAFAGWGNWSDAYAYYIVFWLADLSLNSY